VADLDTAVEGEVREGSESVIEDLEAPAEMQKNVSGGVAPKLSSADPTV
jgi:hypothetical protein